MDRPKDDLWRGISVAVFASVCVFASSSWIGLNAVWVELPLMIGVLPESWTLPSYLVVVIQVANVGPLMYTVAGRLAPGRVRDWAVVYAIVGIGLASCLLLAFHWDKTTTIVVGGGAGKHATALLALAFFLALVDCTSSVVFLPYMAQYAAPYLTAFYVGEGLSGLVPSALGLVQGVGGDPDCVNETVNPGTGHEVVALYGPPRFSVGIFFGILSALLCCSGVAFTLLHFHPKFRAYRSRRQVAIDRTDSDAQSLLSHDDENHVISSSSSSSYQSTPRPADSRGGAGAGVAPSNFSPFGSEAVALLATVACVNALSNGVLPAIQSFSCLPYGSLAYSLAVRLAVLANPVACFLGLVVRVRDAGVCVAMATVGAALAGYQIALAALSPRPPLQDHVIGAVLAVSSFSLLTAIFSFTKMSVAAILSGRGGARALLWCGGVTQIGSCVGAVVAFLLVNVGQVFKSKDPCT